ncbi:hypothetical protein [Paraburkholderia dilworthii]|uniref:hypothetical protein n=1 Tax=Paraburkholderia dilworthii TaxID=948106 RepID=UPI000415E5C0|nr:hypothetical protein [Paraburkholderia dilworthii]
MSFRMRFTRTDPTRHASRFSPARAMRPRVTMSDEQRVAVPHRRPLRASNATAVRKARVWATIIVVSALVIAVQRFMANADVPRELPGIVSPTNCPARYAALLDLAELARRDGTASDVVMRGLSNGEGAMNACPRMSINGRTP